MHIWYSVQAAGGKDETGKTEAAEGLLAMQCSRVQHTVPQQRRKCLAFASV